METSVLLFDLTGSFLIFPAGSTNRLVKRLRKLRVAGLTGPGDFADTGHLPEQCPSGAFDRFHSPTKTSLTSSHSSLDECQTEFCIRVKITFGPLSQRELCLYENRINKLAVSSC